MSVYRPQYTDKKSGTQKRTKVWYYKFIFAGRLIKESAKSTSKTVAKEAEKKRRRELEESFNGIRDERDQRVRLISEVAATFLKDYSIRQPKSATFAKYALGYIVPLCGAQMTVEISDRRITSYQTERLAEGAAPKTINEEIQLFLRLLPAAQAGAVRAELKEHKRLKLKVSQKVGEAYSDDEKLRLLEAAKQPSSQRVSTWQ